MWPIETDPVSNRPQNFSILDAVRIWLEALVGIYVQRPKWNVWTGLEVGRVLPGSGAAKFQYNCADKFAGGFLVVWNRQGEIGFRGGSGDMFLELVELNEFAVDFGFQFLEFISTKQEFFRSVSPCLF